MSYMNGENRTQVHFNDNVVVATPFGNIAISVTAQGVSITSQVPLEYTDLIADGLGFSLYGIASEPDFQG